MTRNYLIGFALAAALGASQAQAEDLTGTLKNIKDAGAITLGYRESSIPFSYLDDNQKPIGYAMDICYKVVEAVKKELKLDKLEVTLKQVAFTNAHFLTATRFVSKKSSKINSIDDLKGKPVASPSFFFNDTATTE